MPPMGHYAVRVSFISYVPQLGFILGSEPTAWFGRPSFSKQFYHEAIKPYTLNRFDEVRQVVRGRSSPCRYTIVPWPLIIYYNVQD